MVVRIIEIEWAVKNDKPFVPSPKRQKNKAKKLKTKVEINEPVLSDSQMDVDDEGNDHSERPIHFKVKQEAAEFGMELTNSPTKRSIVEQDRDDESLTPAKKQRRSGDKRKIAVDVSSDDEWAPPAPAKKGKRKLGC